MPQTDAATPTDRAAAAAAAATDARDTTTPGIYLNSLRIENFRAIKDSLFKFQPGLNVIIGENNSAKTAVVDALRLIFALGSFEKKDDYIRVKAIDIHLAPNEPRPPAVSVTLTATFAGRIDGGYTGQFYELYCPGDHIQLGQNQYAIFKLQYSVQFSFHEGKGRYEHDRASVRGGPDLENPVAPDVLDSIRAVYLAPLRDLINDRARVGSEIERLIVSHTPKGKEADLRAIPEKLRSAALDLIREVTGNKHHAAASDSLSLYAKPYGIAPSSVAFTPWGITEGLLSAMSPVFSHLLHGEEGKLPLTSNGLGLNQLIYASIVLSRQGPMQVDSQMCRFFVIEEPEAHLHPQLQDSFFHALNNIADQQVFVTSHSPSITAKADLDRVIVMQRSSSDGAARPRHLRHALYGRDNDKKYLHKFLDVTRSQLLFARGAIFVEGVTEAMLLQQFSEILGLSLRDAAVELVVVDAAHGFDHFKPLFKQDGDTDTRAVFITDSDVKPSSVVDDATLIGSKLGQFDDDLAIEDKTIAVATGYGTFEFGLLLAAIADGKNPAMQRVLEKALRLAVPHEIGDTGSDDFIANFLDFKSPSLTYQRMKANTSNPSLDWSGRQVTNGYWKKAKSDFSFHLSEELTRMSPASRTSDFVVPKYIEDAIVFVVGGCGGGTDATHR